MTDNVEERVAQHYARSDLEAAILDALAASGKDLERLLPVDLAPVDEFHTGGRQATIEFAAQIDLTPEMHLLDIGCGIGGPSRFLAGRRLLGPVGAGLGGPSGAVDAAHMHGLDAGFDPGGFDAGGGDGGAGF